MTAVADDAAAAEAEPAAGDLACSDCGETFESALLLGAHRFHKHGIRGSKAKAKGKATGAKPRPEPGGPEGESARQSRRRKLVRDTLTEFVSFTDEVRGRADGEPDDLADVIRRDADKIANSVAWIAERFVPLGRVIDLLFGHGGPLTVARGFLGVGTWTLAHWRKVIDRQRQAEVEGPTAEEIAARLEAEYGRSYLS